MRPESGAWPGGRLEQVELLDTTCLRFLDAGTETNPKIVYHNFTVACEEFNNTRINPGVVFIPLADVEGVDSLGGLYDLVAGDGQEVRSNDATGVLTCKTALNPGATIAIYDGTLNDNGTVDGDMGYYKIREDLGGGCYAFGAPEVLDVLFTPDVIPAPDDGSFDDGRVVLDQAALAFQGPLYDELKLNAATTVDVGDYIAFYTELPATADQLASAPLGRITGVEPGEGGLTITYEPATLNELHASADMYLKVPQVAIPYNEEHTEEIRMAMERQVVESGFAELTSDYIVQLLSGEAVPPDDPEIAEALKNMTFKTETGEDIKLEELQRLTEAAQRVQVSDVMVTFTPSLGLEHFSGEGLRLVITVGFTITVTLVGNSQLVITVAAALEQEFVLGLDVAVDSEWSGITLEEVTIDAGVRVGTFTGFGAQATVKTKEKNPNENGDWGKLLDATGDTFGQQQTSQQLLGLATKLEKFAKGLDKVQNGGTVYKSKGTDTKMTATGDFDGPQYASAGGDLPTKYSAMLENDSEYVPLFTKELFRLSISPGPLKIVNFSIAANLVVKLRVNAMIGFSLSYGNCKQFCYHIKVLGGTATSSTADVEVPNFRADFFVFGMLGVRAGIELDARVGMISTKLDSVGLTAELGFYAELYGFLYIFYTWRSGEKPTSGAMGSLLFEAGTYLEIKLKAQIGDDKLSTDYNLYNKTWRILQLGAVEVPVPFQANEEDDAALRKMLEIQMGKNTVKVPDAVFGVDMMALKTGKVKRKSQDSKKVGGESYSFEVNGRKYTQYNELHFDIACYDLDGENGKVIAGRSFQYLPATNEIYVKPADTTKDEAWGLVTFTYRNESFGFSTVEFQRELKVHWKGEPCSAVVEYYLQRPDKSGYDMFKEGAFDGFDGIEYDLVVNEAFFRQCPGYILKFVDFPDQHLLSKKADEYEAVYKQAVQAYKQYKGNSYRVAKRLSNAREAALEKWNAYAHLWYNYCQNLGECLKNRKGTMYFLMVKNQTVVKLYFDMVVNPVSMYVVEEVGTGYNWLDDKYGEIQLDNGEPTDGCNKQ